MHADTRALHRCLVECNRPDRADIHLDASVGSLYKTDMSLPHDLQTMLHQKVAGTGASRGAGAASVVQRFQQSGQLKYSKEYGDDTVEAYCKSLELFCDGVDASALNDGSAKAGDGAHGDSVVAKICASRILNATLRDLTNNPETAPGEGEAVVEEEGVAEGTCTRSVVIRFPLGKRELGLQQIAHNCVPSYHDRWCACVYLGLGRPFP